MWVWTDQENPVEGYPISDEEEKEEEEEEKKEEEKKENKTHVGGAKLKQIKMAATKHVPYPLPNVDWIIPRNT